MKLKPIKPSDLVIGSPLLWDVYDDDEMLLLRKGHVLESVEQLDEMAERGLLIEAHFADNLIRTPTAPSYAAPHLRSNAPVRIEEAASALRLVNAANKRLERLLHGLHNEPDARQKLLEIAALVTDAVSVNPDVALGCVMLNQSSCTYAIRHCVDTAIVAVVIARAMQKTPEEISIMVAAALTMNLGMLRQQDGLQGKALALNEAERALVIAHPQTSVELLQQAGITDAEWLAHVLLHHENEDGSGYPLGAKVGAMPQTAKILALSDRYCACVAQRAYRKVLPPQLALREALFAAGKPRDPLLAAYFVKELGTYPPGTMVRLRNGEVGVMTARPKADAAAAAHAVFGARGEPLSLPLLRDTGKETHAIVEAVPAGQFPMRFSLQQLWGNDAAS